MGLDMYLNKKHFIWSEDRTETQVVLKKKTIDSAKVSTIIEDIGYWRKANQIHKWFVENVQDGEDDCKEYYVSYEKLKELLAVCKKVKKASNLVKGKIVNGYNFDGDKKVPIMEDGELIEDPSVAEELLPAQKGFFFGGTEYDQYYMEDINDTIKIIEEALKDENDGGDIYYSSRRSIKFSISGVL